MKTATFSTGKDSIEVESKHFKAIRGLVNSGIPKNEIKSGREIYVAPATLERIKKINQTGA